MNIFTEGLETERMYLVPLNETFAEYFFRELDEETMKYLTPVPAKYLAECIKRIQNMMQKIERRENISLVGVSKASQEFIGGWDISGIGNAELKI